MDSVSDSENAASDRERLRYNADDDALSWPTAVPETVPNVALPTATKLEPSDGEGDGDGVAVTDALADG